MDHGMGWDEMGLAGVWVMVLEGQAWVIKHLHLHTCVHRQTDMQTEWDGNLVWDRSGWNGIWEKK